MTDKSNADKPPISGKAVRQAGAAFGSYVPPNAVDAEQSVLGAVLIEMPALDRCREAGLTRQDFYRETHQTLWEVIEDLAARNEPVDLVTVREALEKRGALGEIGGIAYLLSLFDTVPTAANAEHYARIVVHHAVRRRICAAGLELMALGQQESETPEAVTQEAETCVMRIADSRCAAGSSETVGQLLRAQYDHSEAMSERGLKMLGLSTGLPSVDRLTSGLQSPDLVILAARPGMGKTSWTIGVALHIALRERRPAVLFSLEMSKQQYAIRVVCLMAGLDSQKLRKGQLTEEEWARFAGATRLCYDIPLVIDDTPSITAAGMASALRRVRRKYGDLAFASVDFLQLMGTPEGGRNENRTQAVSELARNLKAFAMTESIPLVALSQLSRTVESRANKRPFLSDINESGAIEAAADTVAFLYNEQYYARQQNPDHTITEATVDEIEFIVAKHRNGPTGIVKIGFQPTYTRFADIAMRDDAPTGF